MEQAANKIHGHLPPTLGRRRLAADYPPPTFGCLFAYSWLPAVGRLLVAGHWPPVTGPLLLAADDLPPSVGGGRPPTAG